MKTLAVLIAIAGLAAVGSAEARQAAPAAAPQAETPPVAASAPEAAGPKWNPVSRSSARVYLANVGEMTTADGVTSVLLASVRNDSPAGDYSHEADVYEYRCAQNQVRTTLSYAYGPDGAETDHYNDPSAWEAVRPETMDAYLKAVACDDARAANTYPSLQAYIDAGRP